VAFSTTSGYSTVGISRLNDIFLVFGERQLYSDCQGRVGKEERSNIHILSLRHYIYWQLIVFASAD